MPNQVVFSLRNRNPDVLTCIANLSNDEVFTPPELAGKMLDQVADAWACANLTERTSGPIARRRSLIRSQSRAFLREITARLTESLKDEIPDLRERVDHILTKQIFGIAITHLTAMLARRSVYCSKAANQCSLRGPTIRSRRS